MPQEKYLLSLIDQTFNIEVPRTVFDSKLFTRLPQAIESAPKNRSSRIKFQGWIPLTQWNAEIFHFPGSVFEQFCQVLDNGRLHLKTPSGETVKVAEIRARANDLPLNHLSLGQRLDKAAQELAGGSYSDLIKQARTQVIERFMCAFDSIQLLHPMELSVKESQDMRENFTHNPIWAAPEVLGELRDLADQGHAYSQYLAGVLLATITGKFSTDCINYLIAAYKQKVPDAMAVLAEFCFMHRDYCGTLQCALLSVDGGHTDSLRLIKKCFSILNMQVYEADDGIIFGSQLIPVVLRESGFTPLMQRVLSKAT